MLLKEGLKSIWHRFDALAAALDYDPIEELRTRIARLESNVAPRNVDPQCDDAHL